MLGRNNPVAMGRLTRICFALVLISIGASSGCDEEPLFIDCPLSNSIVAACKEAADTTKFTCVVADHPFCFEKICASWKGSGSFCSRSCTSDGDCPPSSTCRQHLNSMFCVPNGALVDTDTPTTGG